MGPKLHDKLKAALIRHIDIGYDQVHSIFAPKPCSLLTVPGLKDLIPSLLEPDLKRSTDTRVVIGY